MKSLLKAAAFAAFAAVVIIYVQHRLSGKYIEDPTVDIWH